MPGRWADDAHMGNPIAHDGQNLVGVSELAGDDEPAVFEFFVDALLGDELAPPEVRGGCGSNGEDGFGLFFVQPDAVFLVEQVEHLLTGSEVLGQWGDGLHLAQGIGFDDAFIGGARYHTPAWLMSW